MPANVLYQLVMGIKSVFSENLIKSYFLSQIKGKKYRYSEFKI